MYPQNPYQPSESPQQPPVGPPAQPPTLSHPDSSPLPSPAPTNPVMPPPSAYSQQPQQPPQPGMQLPAPVTGTSPSPRDYSIDYLNQIAPTPRKKINPLAVFGLIGGILVAAGVAIFLLVSGGSATPSLQMQQSLARISTLQTVSDAQQKHLAENDINQANATLSSALASMKSDLAAIMKTQNVKASDKKTATAKTEAAYLAKLQKKLDDSYQRGTLDRTYTSQMTYELTLLRSKLKKLQTSSDSTSLDTFCSSAITNIDAILTAYANSTETE